MFTDNLILYLKTGNAGKCPHCNCELYVEIIQTPIRNNCMFSCKRCGKRECFTGVTKKAVTSLDGSVESTTVALKAFLGLAPNQSFQELDVNE